MYAQPLAGAPSYTKAQARVTVSSLRATQPLCVKPAKRASAHRLPRTGLSLGLQWVVAFLVSRLWMAQSDENPMVLTNSVSTNPSPNPPPPASEAPRTFQYLLDPSVQMSPEP